MRRFNSAETNRTGEQRHLSIVYTNKTGMGDITFPTTAAASEPADPLCLHHQHRLPFPLFASSPPCFPPSTVSAVRPVAMSRTVAGMEGQELPSDAGRRAERKEEFVRGAEGEEKMDLLWENFNDELEALHRCGSWSKAAAAAAAAGLELSDTESEPAGRRHGCVPMLRPSSRAGGTGHYRRATSWVLLMRIFRRLFVVEKTISPASRRHRQVRAHRRSDASTASTP